MHVWVHVCLYCVRVGHCLSKHQGWLLLNQFLVMLVVEQDRIIIVSVVVPCAVIVVVRQRRRRTADLLDGRVVPGMMMRRPECHQPGLRRAVPGQQERQQHDGQTQAPEHGSGEQQEGPHEGIIPRHGQAARRAAAPPMTRTAAHQDSCPAL